LDSDGERKYVYQNSWASKATLQAMLVEGFITRSIGIALMVHSDDKGAVIPPLVIDRRSGIQGCHSSYNDKRKK
jgi:prolyl-tRNA synthetase